RKSGRQVVITTWRPDLRSDTKVIRIVSEVWRRFSPFPFSNGFVSVMAGGGKCGPRSWFGEMTSKAFGLPSMAMGQPAHSAVAYKSPDPWCEPQPGSSWKICHGGGWHITQGGYHLISEECARDRVELFSEIEHLTWLASSLTSKEKTDAILNRVHLLQAKIPVPGKGPNPAVGDNGEAIAIAIPSTIKPQPEPSNVAEAPFETKPGVIHVEAETFTKSYAEAQYPNEQKGEVFVLDCATGGKQVNFQRNMKTTWLEYTIDVPAPGTYALELRTAAVNFEQVLELGSEGKKLADINVPNSAGLWETTKAVDVNLAGGRQTFRITAPMQRGVAIRWLEFKLKQ
ncbi:MAG: hypothetical protein WCN98_04420, partial [Verrucomicrobiaceae bacterium]